LLLAVARVAHNKTLHILVVAVVALVVILPHQPIWQRGQDLTSQWAVEARVDISPATEQILFLMAQLLLAVGMARLMMIHNMRRQAVVLAAGEPTLMALHLAHLVKAILVEIMLA